MERQEIVSPSLKRPVNVAKKAPSMQICDLFAAFRDKVTWERSDVLNPALRNASRDYRFDWAPVSATAVTSTSLGDASLGKAPGRFSSVQ